MLKSVSDLAAQFCRDQYSCSHCPMQSNLNECPVQQLIHWPEENPIENIFFLLYQHNYQKRKENPHDT